VTPTKAGNLLVAGIATTSEDASTIYALNGGGVEATGPGSWARAATSGLDPSNNEVSIWSGLVATLGPQVLTLAIVPSLSTGFPQLGLYVSEFSEDQVGSWSQVAEGTRLNTGASYIWPALTSGPGDDQLYYAMGGGQQGAAVLGQTPGFELALGAGAITPLLLNPGLSPNTGYQPSVPAVGTGATTCVGVVFRGAGPAVGPVPPGTLLYPDIEGDFKVWLQHHELLSGLTAGRVFFRLPKDNPTPPFLRLYRLGGGPNPLDDTPVDMPRMAVEVWHTMVSGSPPPYAVLRQTVRALQTALFQAQGVLLNPKGSTTLLSGSVIGVVDAPDPDLGWPRLVVDMALNVRVT
jgi:hypothetical protein